MREKKPIMTINEAFEDDEEKRKAQRSALSLLPLYNLLQYIIYSILVSKKVF